MRWIILPLDFARGLKIMNLAVIKTGGKQYKVFEGQVLNVEKIDKKAGVSIDFDKVLLYSDAKTTEIGRPFLKDVKVLAKVLEQKKDKKITVIKFKSKTRYRRKRGHRQFITKIKIEKIGKK